MNAFNKFSPPDSKKHTEWVDAVDSYCRSLAGSEAAHAEVTTVLEQVQAAVHSGQVEFDRANAAQGVDFMNGLLDAVRRVMPSATTWSFQKLVPPSMALFVQPEDDTRFGFQAMFTL